ncbi:MAG TPA: polysaccharide deacetylase family protein, partial [Polyangia bacterium]|nr:polysaccharide deacetylase family protein [Polyangia bacterium]
MRTCSVSIDLDPLSCYYGIHGLGAPPRELAHVVLRRALPRFAELFARRNIRATFFVVGSDAASDTAGGKLLGQVARDGHELGNHSHTHPYDLARLHRAQIDEEVWQAHETIGHIAGKMPTGFRAPGYDLSAKVLQVLEARGYRYDSSVFPSWPYYVAKAGVMTLMSLVGRRSRSVLGDPRALVAPVEPYRPGNSPFTRGQSSLVELPVSVTPGLRLPAIGSWAPYVSLLLAPTQPYRPGKSPFARGQSTIVELPVATTPGLRMPAIGNWAPHVSLLSSST